jgi:site-specific DNA recombinase
MSAQSVSTKLIKAVGYLRRSTDRQEKSLPEQQAEVQAYADKSGYRVVHWYQDDAISGDATDERRGFLAMIADAVQRGDFRAILCWDKSRFGRFDSLELGFYAHQLRLADVYLATVMDGVIDWNQSSGRIVDTVMQEGKHQWLIDHSAAVTRGMLHATKDGSWCGSPPYGYRIVGKKYEKKLVLGDPSHVRIVQRIFRELVEEGRAINDIVCRLNREGVLSPAGKVAAWHWQGVRCILENPAYCGDFAKCRETDGKYNSIRHQAVTRAEGKKGRGKTSPDEWIIRRDTHEPIIDRRQWERAQQLLADRRMGRKPRSPCPQGENPYLLSGLVRCGRCGAPMYGVLYRHGSLAYECAHRKANGPAACQGTVVKEGEVLHEIADYLNREFFALDGTDRERHERRSLSWRAERGELQPGDLPEAFAKVKALVAPPTEPGPNRKLLAKLAKTLAANIEASRGKLNRNLIADENLPGYQQQMRDWQTELEQVQAELRKRPPTAEDINAEALEVLRSLWWLKVAFRLTANPPDPDGEAPDGFGEREDEGSWGTLVGDWRPVVKQCVRGIESVVVHTEVSGQGGRTRHRLLSGEITFAPVGQAQPALIARATTPQSAGRSGHSSSPSRRSSNR